MKSKVQLFPADISKIIHTLQHSIFVINKKKENSNSPIRLCSIQSSWKLHLSDLICSALLGLSRILDLYKKAVTTSITKYLTVWSVHLFAFSSELTYFWLRNADWVCISEDVTVLSKVAVPLPIEKIQITLQNMTSLFYLFTFCAWVHLFGCL